MRLKTKTDYCIRILIYLQLNKKRVKIKDIAEYYNISKNHLSVAVNMLSENGYVKSTLGPKGGIEFDEDCKDRTLGELVSKLEGLDIVECFDPESNTCILDPHCKLKGMLSRATSSFVKELDKHKIKDLI